MSRVMNRTNWGRDRIHSTPATTIGTMKKLT